MPWHVEEGGGTCDADQWAVIKDTDGSTAGCHATEADADDQVAALYANEEHMNSLTEAGALRAQALGGAPTEQRKAAPSGTARLQPFPAKLEVRDKVNRNGRELRHLHGTAAAYEQIYEMWDAFGPYSEGVRASAGAASLGRKPDVAFLENHRGITMARTTNGTLDLTELPTGLEYDAFVNPERQDVRDLLSAVDDGLVTESSFAFWITDGEWNDDYTEFWIKAYEIHRGDVSAVNYGANPYTSVAARANEVLADLDHLPVGAARAAMARLQQRLPDLGQRGSQTPQPTPPTAPAELAGASVNLIRARLTLMDAQP
jgi:HK97 family phage prohead protease